MELSEEKSQTLAVLKQQIKLQQRMTVTAPISALDENPYDKDELTVTVTDDITATPTIRGIEIINFTTSETSLVTTTNLMLIC